MQIFFNGKSYSSPEEMPANEHQAYEQMFQIFKDANGNGIPDFLEGDVANNVISAFTSTVNFNGQTYNNVNDLPPEARQKVEAAFAKLNELGIVTMNPQMTAGASTPTYEPGARTSAPIAPMAGPSAITEERGPRWGILLGMLAGLTVCALVAGAAAYFLWLR